MADTGTVKFFNADKGFGFIKPDKGGSDIFVHITAVQASGLTGLTENQKVSYDTEPPWQGPKGRQSSGHRLINIPFDMEHSRRQRTPADGAFLRHTHVTKSPCSVQPAFRLRFLGSAPEQIEI